MNILEGAGFLEVGGQDQTTCDWIKVYPDTCCTNHTCFAKEYLNDIHNTGVLLWQHCNAGTNLTGKAGFWLNIKFWYNQDGIASPISAPQLKADGYKLEYTSKMCWQAHSPDHYTMIFKLDENCAMEALCGFGC